MGGKGVRMRGRGWGGGREEKKKTNRKKMAELLFLQLSFITTGLHIPDVTQCFHLFGNGEAVQS